MSRDEVKRHEYSFLSIARQSRFFPPVEMASDEGLLAIGGALEPHWLIDAYSHGIFPWPLDDSDLPMMWWSPDPRAIIPWDHFHVSRRLARRCRSGKFVATADRDFRGVMAGCATAQDRDGKTWITPEMEAAYQRLHEDGYAHSVETWHDGRLVGGVYGVALRGLFAAESMFYRESDASKFALVALVHHLRARGFLLLDIQMLTPHTARMGAIEIPRDEYLRRLASAMLCETSFGRELILPDHWGPAAE